MTFDNLRRRICRFSSPAPVVPPWNQVRERAWVLSVIRVEIGKRECMEAVIAEDQHAADRLYREIRSLAKKMKKLEDSSAAMEKRMSDQKSREKVLRIEQEQFLTQVSVMIRDAKNPSAFAGGSPPPAVIPLILPQEQVLTSDNLPPHDG